ncbi:MAG TPA: DUF1028 domain-containing protein, partial [Acidimicrobiia bacterium]|nr:DUF1028 domain-containing protein [Acidimicrobiia bacterium]
FNVGRIVPWLRAGVGAVATQSLAEPLYGPRILDLLTTGASAEEALAATLADDDQREVRQVAVVDAAGGVAAHTGTGCIAHAAHIVGDGWSVQANIMRSESVVPAMADAAAVDAPLITRLLGVLEAAEKAGGDLRGSQSAALIAASDGPVPTADLRVEDHPDPIGEMRRLVALHRLYEEMTAGDDALAVGDQLAAARHYADAAADPRANPEVRFWQAVGLAAMGEGDAARAALRSAAAENEDLLELLGRLREVGLVDESTVAILAGSTD